MKFWLPFLLIIQNHFLIKFKREKLDFKRNRVKKYKNCFFFVKTFMKNQKKTQKKMKMVVTFKFY